MIKQQPSNVDAGTGTEEEIGLRVFMGCPISSEIRMHLNQSIEWKHHKILNPSATRQLQEVHHHEKDYFGFYLKGKKFTVKDLLEFQKHTKHELKKYCPEMETENIKVCIFPQVFIA